MTHHLFHTCFPQPLPLPRLEALRAVLPLPLQEKTGRFHRWQDAHASLLGYHLLLRGMQHLGYPLTMAQLQRDAQGRPFAAGFPDFNISHSGTMVLCAISGHGRIGIDVEWQQPIAIHDFKDQFSAPEWLDIVADTHPPLQFYHYWTRKEAVLKADGRGIITSLPALDTAGSSQVPLDNNTWHLDTITDFPGYACHLASAMPGAGRVLHALDFTVP